MKADFLVIGTGIAGLTYIIKVAEKFPEKSIIVINKDAESNTQFAQGGVAIVQNETDSFKKHFTDTLISGDHLCNPEIVKMVIRKGPKVLEEMLNWGVQFDHNKSGNIDLGKEGGHSENRVVHYKDITGAEISRALHLRLKKLKNVTFLSNHFAIELISDGDNQKESVKKGKFCYGVYVLNKENNQIIKILSKITVLATGGIGQVYGRTTNPQMATGDGIAMAYRAGAVIKEIEFIQFHPTVLNATQEHPTFLISEAVRGDGAKLKNSQGVEFMYEYDPRGALASRDIVSRAIESELKKTGENCVYLDCTAMDPIAFSEHFPTITEKCKQYGINVHTTPIPVIPAVHYVCGGVQVDRDGKTSIENLFACGECSQTGMHGANRLASNSLLEAFVFADQAAEKSAKIIDEINYYDGTPDWYTQATSTPEEIDLIAQKRKEIQEVMQNYVGIVRSNNYLRQAHERIKVLSEEIELLYQTTKISPQLCELRNLANVAALIVSQSQVRVENKGGFYNIDLV